MLIAIDHGNYAVKTNNTIFISGITEYPVKPPLALDIIEFEGSFWTLTGSRITYQRNKTRDNRFFILTLFAIVKELMEIGELSSGIDIDLAVGLPPEHFSMLREDFTNYFKRNNVKFIYNDEPISLNIRNVFTYPQAYAAIVPQSRRLEDIPRLFIVDIGGYTSDVLLLRNGKPDLLFCRSLEMGIIDMNNAIIGKINARYDIKIEDDHIAEILQGKNTLLPDHAAIAVYEMAKAYANDIIDKLRELQADLRANPSVFIGGGAALFRRYIENSDMVVKSDFIPDLRANAIGYTMLAQS